MLSTKTKLAAGLSLALAGAFALSACSGTSGSGSTPMSSAASAPMATQSPMAGDAMTDLVGAGCADYAKAVPSGAGSVEGMSTAPLATAASNNPLLTTLVSAVSGKLNPDVNLVDTLNGSQFTVFAPVDDAFKKIDSATIDSLKTDSAALTKILTYHVVPGQISPDKIDGTHKTVEGQDLTVSGSGDNIMVNGTSTVICGGVKTANATVYLIDTLLMPPAM